MTNPTGPAPAQAGKDPRIQALRRFAISITAFNVLGYIWFGFEQPWLWPFMAIGTAYATDLLMETFTAWAERRPPQYRGGGLGGLVDFLLPAHITGLAVNMLLYANDRPLPVIFAVVVAVSQKSILRAPLRGRMRHFMNPSNFGITVTLLLFSWISIAPPYEFSENVDTPIRWIIPAAILLSGTMLNAKLTRKMPLITAWLGAFAGQAVLRHFLFGTAWISALVTMTGIAFVLFTNYMITDPGTTPMKRRGQIVFGAATGIIYGVLMAFHVVYGLFFAVTLVCLLNGALRWAKALGASHPRRSSRSTSDPRPTEVTV